MNLANNNVVRLDLIGLTSPFSYLIPNTILRYYAKQKMDPVVQITKDLATMIS